MALLFEDITGKILAVCFEASNELGIVILEAVNEKALLIALHNKRRNVFPPALLTVPFRDHNIGHFLADIMVENCNILIIKETSSKIQEYKADFINHLKVNNIEVGMYSYLWQPEIRIKKVVKNDHPN